MMTIKTMGTVLVVLTIWMMISLVYNALRLLVWCGWHLARFIDTKLNGPLPDDRTRR